MALHFLIAGTYLIVAGWAALGLPAFFPDIAVLHSVLIGLSVLSLSVAGHLIYVIRVEQQDREYDSDTIREAVTDALQQIEIVRREMADREGQGAEIEDMREAVADAIERIESVRQEIETLAGREVVTQAEARDLLERDVLKSVLSHLEGIVDPDRVSPAKDNAKVDDEAVGEVKARNS